MKNTLPAIIGLVIALSIVFLLCYGRYYIWRKAHPDAPTWTYFVGG